MIGALAPQAVALLDDCASRAVGSRQKIKDYHLKFDILIRERPGETTNEFQYEFEAWKKGEKYRLDRKLIKETENAKNNGTRWVYCRNCEREGIKLATSMGPNSITPVMMSRLDDNDPRHYHIDWSQLGLRRSDLYNKDARPDMDLLAIRRCDDLQYTKTDNVAGRETRFHCDARSGVLKITFDEAFSGNPTYFYLDARRGNDVLVSETVVVYQAVEGIHYPKSFHYHSKMNGKHTISEILITTQFVEFNHDIDDSIFTLAGLNLRQGHPVRLPEIQDSSLQPTWKDGKLDREMTWSKSATEGHKKLMEQKAENPVPDVAPGLFGRQWPYFLGAGFFAVAGFLIARKIRRG